MDFCDLKKKKIEQTFPLKSKTRIKKYLWRAGRSQNLQKLRTLANMWSTITYILVANVISSAMTQAKSRK